MVVLFGFLSEAGPIQRCFQTLGTTCGRIIILYFPPSTILPYSQVGFNCHNLAPEGYKGKYDS